MSQTKTEGKMIERIETVKKEIADLENDLEGCVRSARANGKNPEGSGEAWGIAYTINSREDYLWDMERALNTIRTVMRNQ